MTYNNLCRHNNRNSDFTRDLLYFSSETKILNTLFGTYVRIDWVVSFQANVKQLEIFNLVICEFMNLYER